MQNDAWKFVTSGKMAFASCLDYVCERHKLSRTEADILIFLSDNPEVNTASRIVEERQLAKSHVSTSLKELEELGYIKTEKHETDKRATKIKLLEKANAVLRDGRCAMEALSQAIVNGFSDEEIEKLCNFIRRISKNVSEIAVNGLTIEK